MPLQELITALVAEANDSLRQDFFQSPLETVCFFDLSEAEKGALFTMDKDQIEPFLSPDLRDELAVFTVTDDWLVSEDVLPDDSLFIDVADYDPCAGV